MKTMRSKIIFLSLIALFLIIANQSVNAENLDVPVEVVGVKDLGVSANDDSKSIIEVRWRVNPALNSVASFNLTLIVSYADGTTIDQVKKTDEKTVSARFEVPSVKVSKGKQPAFIKKMNAVVTAVIREKSL
jgi:hypothetical protein